MSPLTVEGVYKVHMAITILVSFHTFFTVMMTEAFVQIKVFPTSSKYESLGAS